MITHKETPAFIPTGIDVTQLFSPLNAATRDATLPWAAGPADASPKAIGTNAIRPKPNVEISDTELRARIGFAHHASAHFTIAFDKDRFTDKEILTLTSLLETSYSSIFYLTHEAFTDRLQVFVIDRQATGLLGRAVHSHFNVQDRALYLARSNGHSIRSNVLALLVHAMRINRYAKHYASTQGWAMMEDAFSVMLQQRIASDEDNFPFFAVEPDVIAQHVIATRTSLKPLSDVGRETTGGPSIEHIILGGAFFTFLADTYSDDRVVEFSKCTDDITDETYQIFFGATLQELETRWRDHIPASLMTLTSEERACAIQHWEKCFDLAN